MAREVISPRRETATVRILRSYLFFYFLFFLNRLVVKLPSKYVCLYSQISVLFSNILISFFLQ